MYIGPWQEYELAKMLSSRRRHEQVSVNCDANQSLVLADKTASVNVPSTATSRSSKHGRRPHVNPRLARIENMRLLYLSEKEAVKSPLRASLPSQIITDEDLIDWGLRLNVENIFM